MKKSNLWHVLWIVGIYAVLVSILYLVVLYKVKWESKDLSTYMYFYNCNHELCTSTTKPSTYYSYVKCEKDICPYIISRNNNIVILHKNNKSYLFDYINDKIISNKYITYKITTDGNYIVKNKNNLYGVINNQDEVIIDFNYTDIADYNNGFVVYKQDGKYGIDNKKSNIYIDPDYTFIILINDKLFGYIEDNKYYIASYNTGLPITQNNYDYLYYINNYIIAIKDKQIDILDMYLESKLIMKISTTYEYTKEKERDSLDIYSTTNYIHFSVYNDNNKYTNYMYDTKSGKLYT